MRHPIWPRSIQILLYFFLIFLLRSWARRLAPTTGAWMERPPTKRPVNILSQTKRPPNISPHVTFCPSDILSPIYNLPRFYVHP
jgi:hypothetical protein